MKDKWGDNMGKVYLIGAGPGDEELITLKAIKALKQCTAVLYDRLAGNGILSYLNSDCKIYYCGKKPGCHYKTQDETNTMLVSLASSGHIVGRIKGGDPYVFGRGGEEGLLLRKAGIEFEVIPGITSAISVLNYAGIPVTSRGYAQSFHVFTGKSAEKLNINWNSAATIEGTLIFLMGLENIETITSKLMENNMNSDIPCAVIMRGTTSKQRKVIGTLSDISSKVKQAKLESPCIIVVGEVVKLNTDLNWYENKPLFGINICVTRSKQQSGSIKEYFLTLGAQVTEINAIKVNNTSEALKEYDKKLPDYDYLIFTSVNSENIFFDYLIENEIDIRSIKAKFAVVGPATEKNLRARGIIAQIKPEKFAAEGLFSVIKNQVKSGDKILIPCSKKSRNFLEDSLLGSGCEVDIAHIYDTQKDETSDLNAFEDVDITIFTSPSIVKNMISLVGLEQLRKKKCLAIGPITEKELIKNGIKTYVCDNFSNEGIITKILEIKNDGGFKNVY